MAVNNEDMSANAGDTKIVAVQKQLAIADAKKKIRNLEKANKALQEA